jgi:hypothetical protein
MIMLVTSVLQYALWPSLTFAVLVLWVFAMLDIDRHRRRGTSAGAVMLGMAVCVSLVAVFTITGIGTFFADPWVQSVTTTVSAEWGASELQGPTRSSVFSFGLENASYAPAGPEGEHGDGALR